MKYKAGNKVKYDSGDWKFYGTVTAIIENSVNPCYRLNVDRMVNNQCKFSITQFEFELKFDNEDDSSIDRKKWENTKIELLKRYNSVPDSDIISNIIKPEPILAPVPEPLFKPEIILEQEPSSEPREVKKEPPKPKLGKIWLKNLELYEKGVKGHVISAWVSYNRKQYRSAKLTEEQLEKLKEINFPFEVLYKKKPKLNDGWEKQLKLWKKGERNSLQLWRQKSVRQYVEGKLDKDKIEKLKEVGILK